MDHIVHREDDFGESRQRHRGIPLGLSGVVRAEQVRHWPGGAHSALIERDAYRRKAVMRKS
ncbi:MAG TPA: hypothetical protein PKE25_02340, partial [Novosphingobium sp.]|nr:hypothetical protein [Novosphingobium sp.]